MEKLKIYKTIKGSWNNFVSSRSIPMNIFRFICGVVLLVFICNIESSILNHHTVVGALLYLFLLFSLIIIEFFLLKLSLPNSINRIYTGYMVTIVLIIALILEGGFTIFPFDFNLNFFSRYKFVVWCNIMFSLLSLTLVYNMYQTQNVHKFLCHNIIFRNKDKNDEIANIVGKSLKQDRNRFCLTVLMSFFMLFLSILLTQIISKGFSFNLMGVPMSYTEAYLTTVYIIVTLFLLTKPNSVLERFLSNHPIEYKFKYSDNYCGIGPILKYLNSSLLFGTNIIFCFLLVLYTFFFESNLVEVTQTASLNNTDPIVLFINFFSMAICPFIFFLGIHLAGFIHAVKAYFKIKSHFENEKKLYLENLEKDDNIESLLMYQIVKDKKIFTPMDKITLPAKLLVTPTFITYLRGKILSTEDIDIFLSTLFK